MNGLTFIPGLPAPLKREANQEHGILKETNREWGRTIVMSPEVVKKVDQMWDTLF